MNRNTAIQAIIGIRNMIQVIPVFDEQSTIAKTAIFQALNDLEPWIKALQEDGEASV